MIRDEVDELEVLRRALEAAKEAVVAARGALIESMGDRMCGCGDSPSAEDVEALELTAQAQAQARAQLERYLLLRSNEVIEQARRAGRAVHARARHSLRLSDRQARDHGEGR